MDLSRFAKEIQYDSGDHDRHMLLSMSIPMYATFNRHQLCVTATGDKLSITKCDHPMYL